MAKIRVCMVDRKEYKYCPDCAEYNPKETWRFLFCSEDCYAIYRVYEAYRDKKMTAEEAQKELANYDLSNVDEFNPRVGVVLKEILSYKPVVKKKRTSKKATKVPASNE